jgi:hypothetical protein
VSAQLASSPPFPLPSVISPLINVATPLLHVTLPSHWAKTSSLPPLHLSATLHPVTYPLEPKSKHWIRTTATGHPPRTVRLPPSTSIKRLSQPWPFFPPLNRVSILPPPKLEHHTIGALPAIIVPFHCCPTPIIPPHNNAHGDELASHLLLSE